MLRLIPESLPALEKHTVRLAPGRQVLQREDHVAARRHTARHLSRCVAFFLLMLLTQRTADAQNTEVARENLGDADLTVSGPVASVRNLKTRQELLAKFAAKGFVPAAEAAPTASSEKHQDL